MWVGFCLTRKYEMPNVVTNLRPYFTNILKLGFVPGKPFQPVLMFVNKPTCHRVEHLKAVSSGLTRKHNTRLERPARDKHFC